MRLGLVSEKVLIFDGHFKAQQDSQRLPEVTCARERTSRRTVRSLPRRHHHLQEEELQPLRRFEIQLNMASQVE